MKSIFEASYNWYVLCIQTPTLCHYRERLWRWVRSYWVARTIRSAFLIYSGHIVFLLPGCTQLLSMLVSEKKEVLQPSLVCRARPLLPTPHPAPIGTLSFTGLSNSVSVRCFKFQCSVGCQTSSFLLTTAPPAPLPPTVSLCDFPLSSAARSSLHLREGTQKYKRLCNEEMGADRADWGRLCSFCCSALHMLVLRHTKRGDWERLFTRR